MSTFLRIGSLLLVLAHAAAARKHLPLFLAAPSVEDAWKGVGAAVAVLIFLAPQHVQRRALAWLTTRARRRVQFAAGVLAVLHGLPASHHLALFLEDPSWTDGWRGWGALVAVAWFTVPVRLQVRAYQRLVSTVRRMRAGVGRKAPAASVVA